MPISTQFQKSATLFSVRLAATWSLSWTGVAKMTSLMYSLSRLSEKKSRNRVSVDFWSNLFVLRVLSSCCVCVLIMPLVRFLIFSHMRNAGSLKIQQTSALAQSASTATAATIPPLKPEAPKMADTPIQPKPVAAKSPATTVPSTVSAPSPEIDTAEGKKKKKRQAAFVPGPFF